MAMGITAIGTMNIIRTKKSVVPVWWAAWIAILLLVFGIPSFVARMIGLSADPVHHKILEGKTISDEELAALEKARRITGSWFPENSHYNDLALVALEKATRSKDGDGKPFYQEAELWQRKALGVSPADAYGWYRLAYLYYLAEGPSSRVEGAWKQSMFSAPYEPRLAAPRLQMAMSLGAKLGEDNRFQMDTLARQAWTNNPEQIAQIAYRNNFVSILETALREDTVGLQELRYLVTTFQENEKEETRSKKK